MNPKRGIIGIQSRYPLDDIGIYKQPCGNAPWEKALAGTNHLREIVVDELRLANGPEGYLYADPIQCGVLPVGYPKL